MKPPPFTLHRPTTVEQVLGLLEQHADASKVLAGGQSLIPVLNLRLSAVDHLIALDDVNELAHLVEDGQGVTIGAMVRQATAEHSRTVARCLPLLARALPLVAHHQIRNRGTIGGSLAHADPAAELPAVALALDGQLIAASRRGRRSMPATEFFLGTWQTALREDELLTAVHFPTRDGRWGHAIEEAALRHGDFALSGVAVSIAVGATGRIEDARFAVFGTGATAVRARSVERAMEGSTPADVLREELNEALLEDVDFVGDSLAPVSYKQHVTAVLGQRAIERAHQEACDAAA